MNNRHYVRTIVREAAARGIAFYPGVKELWCTDALLEMTLALRNPDGSLCPTHPFWWELLETKVRELLQAIPEVGGIIVSPGTRESKVSISASTRRCERCARTSRLAWYTELLAAMHRPLAARGKNLVVRDFSYTVEHQSLIIEAAARCAPDVVISLKNTPHDYYPTFPTNPRIGHCGGQPQHVEFDAWGQFFGLGFFPASVAEDDMFPETVKKAFAMMVDIHGRDEWEPGASRLVQPTPENLETIFAEKAAALTEVAALPAILQADTLGLPAAFAAEMQTMLRLYALYVRGFTHCAHVCFRTRRAAASRQAEDIRTARRSVEEIRVFRDEMVALLGGNHYPHYVYWLFDHKRLDQLAEDALHILAEAAA